MKKNEPNLMNRQNNNGPIEESEEFVSGIEIRFTDKKTRNERSRYYEVSHKTIDAIHDVSKDIENESRFIDKENSNRPQEESVVAENGEKERVIETYIAKSITKDANSLFRSFYFALYQHEDKHFEIRKKLWITGKIFRKY